MLPVLYGVLMVLSFDSLLSVIAEVLCLLERDRQ